MRRWLFLLLCTAPCWVRAQDPSLAPDLFRALHGTQVDTARVQTLAKLCFNLTNASPDSALRFGEEARTLAKRIGDAKGLADAHNNLGYLAINQGHLDVAATHLDTALQLFTTIGNPAYLAVVHSNKGWLAERRSDRVGMLREFQEALKLSELAKDTGNIAVVLYNIGTTYNKMDEFDRARAMLEQAYALERTLGRPDKEANCLLGIGNTYRSQGDVEKAMRYYQLAGPLYQRIGDRVGAGLVEENIGGLYEVTDPARALVHYRSAFTQYRNINSGGDMAYILLAIGSMQKALGQFDQADSSFTVGAALAAAHSGVELLMDYEKQRAELASARGDSKGTLRHYERYVELKDSLRSTGTENELMRLRTAFETERAEKDNELLRIADKEKTERLRARNLQLYGSLLLAALALGGVLLVWRNLRQKRKHADVLEKLNAELNEQQARIEEINGLLKLKVLRTQMDPHFIHNCLNAIR
ncbi:MAG: tetratricopeptide repeat protein, partial [Flavobacteriales bacterium]|nr:tetratricopeptide repeat protein [Flavobacteriales bacterium]